MLKKIVPLAVVLLVLIPALAFAEEHLPDDTIDVEFNFTASEAVILVIGIIGGLTTAYLGYRKASRNDPALKFNITRFLDRVIIAIITSVGLAIVSATNIVELNLVTMFLIFTSTIGTSELALQANALRGAKAT